MWYEAISEMVVRSFDAPCSVQSHENYSPGSREQTYLAHLGRKKNLIKEIAS